jgi:hypothetical protein
MSGDKPSIPLQPPIGRTVKNRQRTSSGTILPKDDRHAEFRETIERHWYQTNERTGIDFPWDVAAGAALKKLLGAHPKLDLSQFEQLLSNRADSDNANFAKHPKTWIGSITDYASGPLNQYGRPMAPSKSKRVYANENSAAGRVNRTLAASRAWGDERRGAAVGRVERSQSAFREAAIASAEESELHFPEPGTGGAFGRVERNNHRLDRAAERRGWTDPSAEENADEN